MKSWKDIWSSSEYQVIQVNFVQNTVQYDLVSVKKGKIKNTSVSLDTLEELMKGVKQNIPVVVHVAGSGVLTRLTEFVSGYKEQLIVNGDKDEFYFNSWHDGSRILVSFFRKNLIEELLSQLSEKKAFLFGVTCGIVPVLSLASENELITLDYTIQLMDGKFVKVERNEEQTQRTVLLGGVFYQRDDIILKGIYSSVVQRNECFEQGFPEEEVSNYQLEYTQFKQFTVFGIALVFTILFALFGNYLYMNSLNQDIADLEVELTLNNDNLSLFEKLKQEKTRKELLIDNAGVYQKHFLTFYLDKISGTIPSKIDLQELYLFPLKEALKEKRKVELEKLTINLVGTTPTSELLEEWMNKLNRFSWIKSVQLVNYLKSEGDASFKLLITLQE
jgi:hypothetical protein